LRIRTGDYFYVITIRIEEYPNFTDQNATETDSVSVQAVVFIYTFKEIVNEGFELMFLNINMTRDRPDMWQGGKLLNDKTKLGVVWVIYDPRWTLSFNNFEKTHFFLPGNRSLELRQTKQQNNVEFEAVEVSFPMEIRPTCQREVRKIKFNCAELCIIGYTCD
jgi:hypothetical protein